MQSDHAALATLEAAERQVERARHSHGGPSRMPPPLAGRFVGGMEVPLNGTDLHLASFGLADADLRQFGSTVPTT